MTVGPGVRVGQDSDASVIERSWDEPEAFAVLFDRHADSVHRYAARRLGTEVAEDLMAETFTTAFQQRFRYNTELADARPWLFGIATNLIGRHRRAEARRLKAICRLPSAARADGSEDPVADRVAARGQRTGLTGRTGPGDGPVARQAPGRAAAGRLGRPRLRGGRPRPGGTGGDGPVTAAQGPQKTSRRIGRIRSDSLPRGIRR